VLPEGMEPATIITAVLNLAVLVAIVVVTVRTSKRWRVLDLATRATPLASPQQQAKMGQLAGDGDLVELEGLARLVISMALRAASSLK
jgi:DNA-binding transcriptional regulator/RsmH inhibitor MraZ